MSGVKRSQFTENYKKDLYGYYWESYPETPTKHEMFFEIVPSDAAYESFTTAIGLGDLLKKPEGEDLQADAPIESYTIVCANWTWGRLVRFSYESIEDSKKTSNLLQSTISSWAKSVIRAKEKFYASFINKGAYTAGAEDPFSNSITGVIVDSSGNYIYDGKPFFATDHSDKVGNTYSNFESPLTLSATNLRTVYNTFTTTNNRDERGNIIDMAPDTLLVHPALRFTAQEILNSTLIPTSGDNTVNVLSGIVNPVDWAYLDGTDDWVLMKAKYGLMATQRQDPLIDFWQDETSLDYYVRLVLRFGGCVHDWRGALGANLATL